MHAFHVIVTIASPDADQIWSITCARRNFRQYIKVLVNTLEFNVFKRNFRYEGVLIQVLFVTQPARRTWRSINSPRFCFFCQCRKLGYRSWVIPLAFLLFSALRLFSTRRNFPRAAQFFFVFFRLVLPESSQTKKNCAAPGKFRLVENSL